MRMAPRRRPGSRLGRAGAAAALLGCGWLCSAGLPGVAVAQAFELERPSVRLQALGGMQLAIPDENNEINLSDFGDNLAGTARDRDSWTVEGWAGVNRSYEDWTELGSGKGLRIRDRNDRELAGLDVVYRQRAERALGGTAVWTARDHQLRYGSNSRVRGPSYRLFYNETFGPLSAAIGYAQLGEDEDILSPNVFDIWHVWRTRTASLAASYDLPTGGLIAAAQVNFDRVRIEGVSDDPAGFHRDEFDWRRPATRVALALLRPEGTGPVAVGAKLTLLERTGREEGSFSWSDRFPTNPSRVNFSARLPMFEEEESGWSAEGRAAWEAVPRLRLSGAAGMRHFESLVVETKNNNFIGSRQAADFTEDGLRVGAGAMALLWNARLRVGAEGFFESGSREETVPREGAETVDSRLYEGRAGVEYLTPRRLALRVGFQASSEDGNVDAPSDLFLARGITAGIGYLPRGGTISLDIAARVWSSEQAEKSAERPEAEAEDLTLGVRLIF